jgi:hypothetical protein
MTFQVHIWRLIHITFISIVRRMQLDFEQIQLKLRTVRQFVVVVENLSPKRVVDELDRVQSEPLTSEVGELYLVHLPSETIHRR